eukprot:TRINITY_DN11209_c1_g1_i1.p1 TRINITY_DN11209_c1_g1~~TRINITY_DN11209_c1_g1_i1.p1  ORF type:complete len:1081 (+),score=128.65 TRINITY_DN11209_c1_g1_i1:355-3243(+)
MEGLLSLLHIHNNETRDFAWLQSKTVRNALWHQIQMADPVVTSLGIYIDNAHYALHHRNYSHLGDSELDVLITEPNSTTSIFGLAKFGDGGLETILNPALPINNSNMPGLAIAREIWEEDTFMWNSLFIDSFLDGYRVTSRHKTESNHFNMEVLVPVNTITESLHRLVTSMRKETNSKTRMYIVIAESWIATKMKANNDSRWKDYDQSMRLVSTSDGDYFTKDPVTGNGEPLLDTDATDTIIKGIALGIHSNYGGYAGLAARGTTKYLIPHDGIIEQFFVEVQGINDTFGISWWLTTAIDLEYILGEIDATHVVLNNQFTQRRREIRSDVDSGRDQAIYTIAIVAVALLVISYCATMLVMRPLKKLQVDMKLVSLMNLDNLQESTTILSEIRNMQLTFQIMVRRLKEFRAYVPTAVLQGVNVPSDIPVPPSGEVGIVFTDIEGSTALWDLDNAAMNIALEQHNEIIREACAANNGYEVKTIGDAFMIAFESAEDAVKFSVQAQQAISVAGWPSELCLRDGLRVRMGSQFGHVILEENPLTSRADYRGTTVNMAARLESKSKGGALCITRELYTQLNPDLVPPSSLCMVDHGVQDLKGLGPHDTVLLYTKESLMTPGSHPDSRKNSYQVTFNNKTSEKQTSEKSEESHIAVVRAAKSGKSTNTGLSLTKSSISVGICSLKVRHKDNLFNDVNLMIRIVADATFDTDGVLGTVIGNTIMVSWNTSKRNQLHTIASMRFASQLHKRGARIMTIGLATGSSLHGNIGSQNRRFHSVFGVPLNCAYALSDHAASLDAFCLTGDCTRESRFLKDDSISTFLRLVDGWYLREEHVTILIYDIRCAKFLNHLENWGAGETILSPKDSISLDSIVQKLLHGDRSAMEELQVAATLSPDDGVLNNVKKMFSVTLPGLEGYRCEINFSRVPHAAHQWRQEFANESVVPSTTPSGRSPSPVPSPVHLPNSIQFV